MNAVGRTQNIFDHALLSATEVWMLVGHLDRLRAGHHGLDLVLSFAHTADDFMLGLDGFGSGELATWETLRPFNDLELPGCKSAAEVRDHLRIGYAHATAECIAH